MRRYTAARQREKPMNKKVWRRVTACPYCGGRLIISEHYTFSRDYTITRKGVLSERYSNGDPGAIDCTTAFCTGCETAFDSDSICIENNGEVWMKCPPEGEEDT